MLRNKFTAAAAFNQKQFSIGLLAALLLAIVTSSFCGWRSAALADDYSQGMALFKARDFKGASAAFHKAIFDRPGDADCFYYYALSCHYAKDYKNAKIGYLEIIQRYPQSGAAGLAQKALATLSPGLIDSVTATPRQPSSAANSRGATVSTYSGSSSSGGITSGDIIPSSSIVNFENDKGHMVIDVAFNGRRIKAVFDTGAESILMGKNHLAEIGIAAPTGPVVAHSRGVDGSLSDLQELHMDVTVGGVTRKNLAVHIMDHMESMPLLGLPFVKGMNYAVENNFIRFSAKNTSAVASYGADYNSVPYTMQGRSIIVQAKVNGKDMAMCLDTGAAYTLFSKSQAAAVGINVENEPDVNLGSGVGGSVSGKYANLNSISLGPVNQRDFRIGVSDVNHSAYPLLGKDFWEGHRFSVDEDRHTIHFN